MGLFDKFKKLLNYSGDGADNSSSSASNSDEPNDEHDSSTSSDQEDAPSENMQRNISAEKAVDAHIKELKGKDDLTLLESLSIGMAETNLAGVTKERAQDIKMQQAAAKALQQANIDLSELKAVDAKEVGEPSKQIAEGFTPDRGEMPSFTTKPKS